MQSSIWYNDILFWTTSTKQWEIFQIMLQWNEEASENELNSSTKRHFKGNLILLNINKSKIVSKVPSTRIESF